MICYIYIYIYIYNWLNFIGYFFIVEFKHELKLRDIDNNQLNFNRDVIVDEEFEPFKTSS